MIEVIDNLWERTKNLNYRDNGNKKGLKTHVFSVHSRHNGSVLGQVRWWATWRQYIFEPQDAVFNSECLSEIAEFVKYKTTQHRSGVPYLRDVKTGGGGQVLDKSAAPVV